MFRLSDKSFSTLSKIQKVILAVMAIVSIIICALMVLLAKNLPDFDAKINAYNFALICLVFSLAMICGLIYANKGYSKEANGYYKAMMCFYAFAAFIPIITIFRVSGFSLIAVVAIIKLVLLLVLGFGKDLGKKNTWIIFYIVLVLDLVFSPVMASTDSVAGAAWPAPVEYYIPSTLARLVITGILGLCVEAKYRDKDARGTI